MTYFKPSKVFECVKRILGPLHRRSTYVCSAIGVVGVWTVGVKMQATSAPSSETEIVHRIATDAFFNTYHGHDPALLQQVLDGVTGNRSVIYLAGDSSLDNKYWFPSSSFKPASNGYERILDPPRVRPDVAWAINDACATASLPYVCINAAVEESTLGSRNKGRKLRPQDAFIRDHIRPQDILIVSVGGNDIALAPTASTMMSIASLMKLSSDTAIDNGTATGLGHFKSMFRDDLAAYISSLVSVHKPRLVLACMIYHPHEATGGSWADSVLAMLGYNTNPAKLQKLISKVFDIGVCQMSLAGTTLVPCPLFSWLDPSPSSKDYIQRVEPSEQGGVKMAAGFMTAIQDNYDKAAAAQAAADTSAASAAAAAVVTATDGGTARAADSGCTVA